MAFSVDQIKRKPSAKQQNIKACYAKVFNNDILTDKIKQSLWQYCNYRFSQRNRGVFDELILFSMIKELLEKICKMPYNSIGITIVTQYEEDILYHIKRAIQYGATRSLFYEVDYFNTELSQIAIKEETTIENRKVIEEYQNYFGGDDLI